MSSYVHTIPLLGEYNQEKPKCTILQEAVYKVQTSIIHSSQKLETTQDPWTGKKRL